MESSALPPAPAARDPRALSLLILSDGRPGHFRQCEAMAMALARRRPVAVARTELRLRPGLPRALAARLARALPSRAYLRVAHGLSADDFPQADLVLSAGAVTFGASIALRRLRGAPNVIAGSLRGLDPADVTLTLLPYARAAQMPNHAYLLKPAAVDPDLLPPARPWGAGERKLGVLVGGPTPFAAFEAEDWSALADLLRALAARPGLDVTVATSRRTPDAAYAALEPLRTAGVSLLDFRAGAPSLQPLFAADALLVTLDSMSMISEAVAARRPTLVLEPRRTRPFRDAEIVADLAAEDRLRVLRLAGADAAAVDAALPAVRPMTENHLDRLADEILRRTGV
jgi:mitochondrial fission protein ELM1